MENGPLIDDLPIENGDVENGHVQSTMESTPLWAKSCF
jgi:hypothetical protein